MFLKTLSHIYPLPFLFNFSSFLTVQRLISFPKPFPFLSPHSPALACLFPSYLSFSLSPKSFHSFHFPNHYSSCHLFVTLLPPSLSFLPTRRNPFHFTNHSFYRHLLLPSLLLPFSFPLSLLFCNILKQLFFRPLLTTLFYLLFPYSLSPSVPVYRLNHYYIWR